jgi:hypothetical protein
LKALLWLKARLALNALRLTFRTPKRLIPVVLIAAWVLLIIGAGAIGSTAKPETERGLTAFRSAVNVESIRGIISWMLILMLLPIAMAAVGEGLLAFSPSDSDFLSPAPIDQRLVLAQKVLVDYVKALGWIGVATLWFVYSFAKFGGLRKPSLLVLSVVALSLYVVFVTNLSHIANFYVKYREMRTRHRSRLPKLVLWLVAASLAVIAVLWFSVGGTASGLAQLVNAHGARIALFPVGATADLVVSPLRGEQGGDGVKLAALCALSLGSGLFLLTRRLNIYEQSLGRTRWTARIRERMRRGESAWTDATLERAKRKGGRVWGGFTIPRWGTGAAALFWKNIVCLGRRGGQVTLTPLVLSLGPVVAIRFLAAGTPFARFSPLIPLWFMTNLPAAAMSWLRESLGQINATKAIPAHPRSVVAGEIAPYAAWIAGFAWIGCLGAWVLIPGADPKLVILGLATYPFLSILSVAAVSIPTLLYPNYADYSQRMIGGLIQMLLMIGVIVVCAGIGAAMHTVGVPIWVTVLTVDGICAAFTWICLGILGEIFRRFEPGE